MVFCLKCGKDVGEFKFCPYCGTAVPEEQAGAWSVGMACPHCGGTQLEGDRCAFCGAQLILGGSVEEEDLFEIPYVSLGALTLFPNHIKCKCSLIFKSYIFEIPFERITRLEYSHPGNRLGELRVYWDPGEDSEKQWCGTDVFDHITLFYDDRNCDVFYHLGYVLKVLAPPSVEYVIRSAKIDPKVLGDVLHLEEVIDMDPYFKEFSPHRRRTYEALYERKGIPCSRGWVLVDRAFDPRQKELYEREPRYAIRDLNLALQEERRRKESIRS